MNHQFRQRLKAGEQLIGPMVTLRSPEVAEILTQVGFDWLFIDAEHSPFEAGDVQTLLQAAGADMPGVVRLPAPAEAPIKKALDVGAAGIIAPMVNSAEQAEQVVRLSKYGPQGSRGVGIGRAHGYGQQFQTYLDRANEEVAVIVQAEHYEAVENIESIVKVEGVDAVLVGPYDLSASLGRPGDLEHPAVTSAIDHLTQTCLEAGVRLGIFRLTADALKPYVERGYTLLVAGVDTLFLSQAAGSLLAQIKDQ